MQFFFRLCAVLLLSGSAFGYTPNPFDRPLPDYPSCETLQESKVLCERIVAARTIAVNIPLSLFHLTKNVEYGAVRLYPPWQDQLREFAVVAWDSERGEFRVIRLAMPMRGNYVFQPLVLGADQERCAVIRKKGATFIKMTYQVVCDGRELFVYASRHLSVPQTSKGGVVEREAELVTYLATPPYLVNEELAALGGAFVRQYALSALQTLRLLGVRSRADPSKLVADVISPAKLINLLVTEQSDLCLLEKRERGCAALVPEPLYPDFRTLVQSIYVEFVLNGRFAFSHIGSHKGAYGAMQFTNNPKPEKKFLGAYSSLVQNYPEAYLQEDFRAGVRDFHNSLIAAALYLDQELAGLPSVEQARMLQEDFRVVMPVLAVSFNAGGIPAQRVLRAIRQYQALLAGAGHPKKRPFFGPPQAFSSEGFLRWLGQQKIGLQDETRGYLWKSAAHLDPRVGDTMGVIPTGVQVKLVADPTKAGTKNKKKATPQKGKQAKVVKVKK